MNPSKLEQCNTFIYCIIQQLAPFGMLAKICAFFSRRNENLVKLMFDSANKIDLSVVVVVFSEIPNSFFKFSCDFV